MMTQQQHQLPAPLTVIEQVAIPKLLDEGLLIYNNASLDCPIPALIKKASEVAGSIEYNPSRPPNLSYQNDALDKAITELKEELLVNVGDDIVASTVFAHDTKAVHDIEQRVHDDPSDPVKNPHFYIEDPGSASAPRETAVTSFDISVNGTKYQVPLSEQDAEQLYMNGTPSEFGVEAEGDHYDDRVRSSFEYHHTEFEVPAFLHNPRMHFPRIVNYIKSRLAPTAEKIATVCWKLVCYSGEERDFFKAHVDSVSDSRHFATLVIHLPCLGDVEDTRPFTELPDDYSYGDSGDESELLGKVTKWNSKQQEEKNQQQKKDRVVSGQKQNNNDDEEEEEGDEESKSVPLRSKGGALRFYLGRGIDKRKRYLGQFSNNRCIYQNRSSHKYGRSKKCSNQLVACVHLSNYSDDECRGLLPVRSSAFANRLAEPLHETPDGNDTTTAQQQKDGDDVSAKGAAAAATSSSSSPSPSSKATTKSTTTTTTAKPKTPSLLELSPLPQPPDPSHHRGGRRAHLPLHFAAWHVDIMHDVRPLKRGYRFVLVYKVLRQGEAQFLHIPREFALLTQVEKIGKMFAEFKKSDKYKPGASYSCFGFILRHQYPIGTLCEAVTINNQQGRIDNNNNNNNNNGGDDDDSKQKNNATTTTSTVAATTAAQQNLRFRTINAVGQVLKGVDAVAFQLLSTRYECIVVPAFLHKDNDVGVPFLDDPQSKRRVFMGTDIPSRVDLSREHPDEGIERCGMPTICNVWFKELGFGRVISQGSMLGNADCGCYWSYATSALICTLKPSHWQRRRVAFLIEKYGYENNMFQRIAELYPVFRNVCYYL